MATFIAGWWYLLPAEFEVLKSHIKWGLAFAANIKLNSEVGYFDTAAELKPLLHLWSLAIEEQFYLVWPALLWVSFRKRLNLFTVTLVLAVLSYKSRKYFGTTESGAFYFPWTRFWELQVGALLAVWNSDYAPRFAELWSRVEKFIRPVIFHKEAARANHTSTQFFQSAMSAVGIALVAYACWKFSKATPFPSRHTLYPVLGAALIIAAGKQAWFNRRVLSLRPMRFVGNISFPLYLWHWPMLAFARIILGEPSTKVALYAIGISVVLSIATYLTIEKFLRFETRRIAWRAPALAAALCGIILFVKYRPTEPRSAAFGIEKISAAIGLWEYPTKGMVSKVFPNGTEYWEISAGSDRNVVFIGSSHMCQWAPAIDKLASEHRLAANVLFIEVSGCGRGPGPVETYRRIVDLLKSGAQFDAIVWAAFWKTQLWEELYQNVTREILALAREKSQRIVFILDYPDGDEFDPKTMVQRSLVGGFVLGPAYIPLTEALQRDEKPRKAIFELASIYGAVVIDPFKFLCTNGNCPTRDPEGYPLYKDPHHFTPISAAKHLTFIGDALGISRPSTAASTAAEKNRKSL
jgi:peptidoglycan/LPS O-acetylase OafA/YrhL